MIERSSPEFASLLGDAIVALSHHFCGVELGKVPPPGGSLEGRDKLDPVYVKVTEHRDGPGPLQRKTYSSCGDQLHAILERLGVRLPFLNRASLKQYQSGANITRLQRPACPSAITPPKDPAYRPPVGALCLIWTSGYDAHALTILGPGSDANHILTGNYGAGGMNSGTRPGANMSDSPLALEMRAVLGKDGRPDHYEPTGRLMIGASKRRLQCVITPASIVPYIDAQIDLSGAEVTGDLINALGARYE